MSTFLPVVLCVIVSISSCYGASLQRVRRQNMGYGGGISMTVALNPHDTRNPINYASNVQYGFGVSAPGMKQSNSLGFSNSLGNGKAVGNSFGGANDRSAFGGGNANTIVVGSPGYGTAQTNNMGFSGSSGNGFGRGGASGMVIPYRTRR